MTCIVAWCCSTWRLIALPGCEREYIFPLARSDLLLQQAALLHNEHRRGLLVFDDMT